MGMIEEIKRQWQLDLRSGEYPQTTGALTRTRAYVGTECGCEDAAGCDCEQDTAPAGHCCLGVLCEQAVQAGIVVRIDGEDGQVGYQDALNPNAQVMWGILPGCVMTWAGLDSYDPVVLYQTPGEDIQPRGYPLSRLNDGAGLTFSAIADLVNAL